MDLSQPSEDFIAPRGRKPDILNFVRRSETKTGQNSQAKAESLTLRKRGQD